MGTTCNSHFAGRDSDESERRDIFAMMVASHCEDLYLFLDTKYVALHRVPNLCTFLWQLAKVREQ